eukprot:1323526-Amorphochlora_amoeboformis.AAC.3
MESAPDSAADESGLHTARIKILEGFANGKEQKLSPELREILADVADCGASRYAWKQLQTLITRRLEDVVAAYRNKDAKTIEIDGEDFDTRYKRVMKFLQEFKEPPFTLQRMCELLHEPERYYRNTEKFFLAFSKFYFISDTNTNIPQTVCGITYPAEHVSQLRRREPPKKIPKRGFKSNGIDEKLENIPAVEEKQGPKKWKLPHEVASNTYHSLFSRYAVQKSPTPHFRQDTNQRFARSIAYFAMSFKSYISPSQLAYR